MNKFLKSLGFDAETKQTSIKTEIVAGIVTFLAMAYILTVNPTQIWGSTKDAVWASIFIATALSAVIGTLLMAFLAKMPLAQASGMGLNALVGGMIGGWTYGIKFEPGQAFMLVLISGLLFLLLSLVRIKGKTFRELVFDGMPVAVRSAISVGIGLFIAYIGFQNSGIIITDGYTQVGLIDFTKWKDQLLNYGDLGNFGMPWQGDTYVHTNSAIVAILGLIAIAVLDKAKVKGSVIFGIIIATLIGIPLGVTNLAVIAGTQEGISWKFWENISYFFSGEGSVFVSFTDVFTNGLIPQGGTIFTVIMIVITMCMIDMFDTMGTIVGCCGGNRILSDENNKPHNYGKIMISDAIATCTGAILGTSTVTTFVESGAGVSAGGRTGLTAFTTACMFFLALFALPLFAAIPSAAAASALIYVGVLMMKNNVKSVNFEGAINATAAFLTIVIMVLSYSITNGIGFGMVIYTLMSTISYVIDVIKYAINKEKNEKPVWNVSIIAIIVTVLFLVYFLVPATLF